jgi:uncharacterized membrane protein YeaQ/YmgE (transglycosylase-associated protein family)
MASALIGGFLARLLGGVGVTGFNVWSILVTTLGAVVLLTIYYETPRDRRMSKCTIF